MSSKKLCFRGSDGANLMGSFNAQPTGIFKRILLSLLDNYSAMTAQKVYDHIADFIAGLDPKRVLELKAPESMRIRLEELITKEKEGILLEGEKDELDHYLVLERLIRLAKAHARMRVMPS